MLVAITLTVALATTLLCACASNEAAEAGHKRATITPARMRNQLAREQDEADRRTRREAFMGRSRGKTR